MSDSKPNPFDDDAQSFLVLVNGQLQHSLWPVFAPLPDGWEAVFGPRPRQDCLAYVEERWTDMRPLALRSRS